MDRCSFTHGDGVTPATPPPTFPHSPPPSKNTSSATPSLATSSTSTGSITIPSSPASNSQTVSPISPTRSTSSLGLASPQLSLSQPSPPLSLPAELKFAIFKHLYHTSSISVLALRCIHPIFHNMLDSKTQIARRRIPVSSRKAEYATAERCFIEGYLQGLWETGLMPCYKWLHVTGKSCFSVDVREGNLAIGAEGFEMRTCVVCGGSDKEHARQYLRRISSASERLA